MKYSPRNYTALSYEDYSPKAKGNDRWLPRGLFWDLNDSNIDFLRTTNGVRYYYNAEGYSISDLFYSLDPNVESPLTYKLILLAKNLNKDRTDVLKLFEAYYY
ncbi:MAG: hypothetical protein IPO21_07945 [Bacteroidales bacterium]|nr:hypothetical protein [Bacteroidales bacterium]